MLIFGNWLDCLPEKLKFFLNVAIFFKKLSCRQGGLTAPLISEGQCPISGRGKKAISQSNQIHTIVTLLYQTLH